MESLGDAREHPRRLTLRGCLQLRSARTSETTSPTLTRDELGHLIKLNLQHRNDYQLGDTFLRRDSERRVAAIPATHHELALIVAVDQATRLPSTIPCLWPRPERGRISAAKPGSAM